VCCINLVLQASSKSAEEQFIWHFKPAPDTLSLGSSGIKREGILVVTAKALSLSARAGGSAVRRLKIITLTVCPCQGVIYSCCGSFVEKMSNV
jgi:hypothetical protein